MDATTRESAERTAGNDRQDRRGSCPACGRRDPRIGLVCDPCYDWYPTALAGIEERYAELPDALVPSAQVGDRVSGSQDPPAPLNVDVADLLTRVVRPAGVPVDATRDTMVPATDLAEVETYQAEFDPDRGEHRWWRWKLLERRPVVGPDGYPALRPAGDQVGYVPVAQVLDSWAREWVERRGMREHLPVPTVPELVDWLTKRLAWACKAYEPIGDFAASLRQVRGWLMNVLGEFDPPPQACDGVQCKRCDRRELFVVPDGSGDRECGNEACRKIYTEEEFYDWVRHLGGYERSQRTPEEIRELLRPTYRRPGLDLA